MPAAASPQHCKIPIASSPSVQGAALTGEPRAKRSTTCAVLRGLRCRLACLPCRIPNPTGIMPLRHSRLTRRRTLNPFGDALNVECVADGCAKRLTVANYDGLAISARYQRSV